MLRNREWKWYLLFTATVIGLGLAAGFSHPAVWPAVFLAASVLLAAAGIGCAAYRYQKLRELAGYLTRIRTGDVSLDVRDNREGELSILKNEIYKLTRMLTEQAELLKKDKSYLAGALSDISHQLKTPVTSMLVLTELLKEETLPSQKRREFLRKLENQLVRIEWLVSTLLKMSRLDAGAVVLKRRRLSVKELLRAAAEPVCISMELKKLSLTLEGEEPAFLTGDREWLMESFTNLLKNCMEHTPAGGSIRIRYEENAIYTGIEIRDTGEGIPGEDLPHIFERFYKGKNSSPDSVGIGLAFARQVILLSNGTIEAENKEDGGACFWIKIYK